MIRDWEAEFKDLNKRERAAFRKLGEALYKISGRTPPAVIDELEQAEEKRLGFELDGRAPDGNG